MKKASKERRQTGKTWTPPFQMAEPKSRVRVANVLERENDMLVSNMNHPIPSTSKQYRDNSATKQLMGDDDDTCSSKDDMGELIIDEDPEPQAISNWQEFRPITNIDPLKRMIERSVKAGEEFILPQKPKRINIKRSLNEQSQQRKSAKLRAIAPKVERSMVGVFEERILNATNSLNEQGKRACGFDITKIYIETGNGRVPLPIWVAIIDGTDTPRFNQIIWYPRNVLSNIDETGLTLDQMNGGRIFEDVRRETIGILMQYDVICVADGLEDFKSLCTNYQDWMIIRPRIRDVSYYYNPRPNPLVPFDLRFSIFLFFQKVIKDELRSPLIYAMYKLFLYLIDYENFESIFDEIASQVTSKATFAIHLYPHNLQMAGLLRKIMNHIGGWPEELLREKNSHCLPQPQYGRYKFLEGTDDLRPPYENVIPRLFNDFIHTEQTHP